MAGRAIIVSLLTLAVIFVSGIHLTGAGTAPFPPLFRDVPIEQFNAETFADDDTNYRLPNSTIPEHYDVTLTTNVHINDFNFTGTVVIDIIVMEETKTITLHARRIDIVHASLKPATGTGERILTYSYEEKREFLVLTTDGAALTKDSKWQLTVEYKGELRRDNGGFYRSSYKDSENNDRSLATTQFESTNARHGFPCYDEPAIRATFTITINHGANYTAISNMPVNEIESTSTRTVFEKSGIMSTYLVAFIVSDFVSTQGVLNNLTQRVYSRPGTENDHEWALVSGMLLIQQLAEYYGIPYATPKLDQVAVPDFAAGAMENWGLVTYREEYLLYNPKNSTTFTQTNVANIIAHEYAHQWFGNLVAIKWWTYLWLKEGFATIFSYEADDGAYPEWDIYQMFQVSEYQRALVHDGSGTARPMTHYVQTPQEISGLYDLISYQKAGSVLHTFKHALTNAVFQQGLHNYLEANKYSSAEEDQLFEGIQTAAKELNYPLKYTIAEMMSTWTRQNGVPLLTVERNYNDGSFIVKQTQFLNDGTGTNSKKWIIPFNYVDQSNPDFRTTEATHYLKDDQISVDAKLNNDHWLLANKQSTTYCRINYDQRNWELIIEGLLTTPYKFDRVNRAQLLNDAYYFTSAKILPHSTLLSLMTYLSAEDQYAGWSTANSILSTLNQYLSGDEKYNDYKFYVSKLVSNIYTRLGVNDVNGEQHFNKNIRNIAINLACVSGIENCIIETKRKLQNDIYNSISVEPNLQSSIYCNGLRNADDKDYDFIYNKLMDSDDQAERRFLISSLGCTQNSHQVTKFISSSIDQSNSLRGQERITLLNSAYSRGEVGLMSCIDFLNENWEAYGKLVPGFSGVNPLDYDIRLMSRQVVNQKEADELNSLVTKVKDSTYVQSDLQTAVDTNIAANFKWLDTNRDPLMSWFGTYKSSASITMASSITTIVIAFMSSMLLLS